MKILVINGPNINFLGIRETKQYGTDSYDTLINNLNNKAELTGCELETFQSNYEGAIIDKLQEAYHKNVDGIIINPGAYTHYSYAIRDAIASIKAPVIEVHITNIHKREEFRHISVTAPVCMAQMAGFGLAGYELAMDYLARAINC